jgi:hypothetical protein
MGANLVPIVRNFAISNETFAANDHSVEDGCVMPGTHRVMRFDFLSHNIGNADLVVGAPKDHPEWFVESASHGHFHLKDFNEFILYDCSGNQVTKGYKQAFCLIDSEHPSSWGPAAKQFTDCNANQGVSAGWADLYYAALPCQFIVIDGIPDGDYVLVSTTNALHLIPEDTYADNRIYTGLHIQGDTVTEIPPCWPPHFPNLDKWALSIQILFGVVNDGPGVGIRPGGGPIPIGPWDPLRLTPAKRDVLLGLAVTELAALASSRASREEIEKAGFSVATKALGQAQAHPHQP